MSSHQHPHRAYLEAFSLDSFVQPGERASWYWQNLACVLPSAPLRPAGTFSPLERELLPRGPVLSVRCGDTRLGEHLGGLKPEVDGMMILQHGKVVFEQHNLAPETHHVWMSCAKSLAGVLVAMLVEEGRVDPAQPMASYMPQTDGTAWGAIPVRDVLNMQSGIDAVEDASSRANGEAPIRRLLQSEFGSEPDYLNTLLGLNPLRPAGTAFQYSSANTQMLGLLIAEVEQASLTQVLQQRIWSKAGMSTTANLALTPDGYEVIHGLLSSTLEDMARYALLLTDSWHATASERVIPAAVVQRIQQGHNPELYQVCPSAAPFAAFAEECALGASYQFDAIWADGDLFKGGLGGQGLYISPERDAVAVWFSNRPTAQNLCGHVRKLMQSL
ncbi:serine hydrolase domain-containing protein [Ferrimonas marina]|uniref:CubicO group peptidase, beta-lactamase class C family n=1 Tax=Ferrimonas marina TaxID=299255 RepID=A0A1M5P7X8_9GAMM|nr:serine hydrolase domain-containing protein [Ferrimonas marina]SHG97797.1 CubicO group peptidase, beta-lactamase class C family [Ferrimonas marina]